CPRRALPGPAGALLAPRLATATPDLGARAGRVRAGSAVGQLGGDDLVHDGHVRLHAEQGVVELDGARLGAGVALDRDGGHHAPAFTASRTRTSPPFGPGTAPLTSRR